MKFPISEISSPSQKNSRAPNGMLGTWNSVILKTLSSAKTGERVEEAGGVENSSDFPSLLCTKAEDRQGHGGLGYHHANLNWVSEEVLHFICSWKEGLY